MSLTLEERERRAYITGRTGKAALLAHCIEGDEELAADAQQAEEQLKEAEDRIADLERALEEAHEIARAALVGEDS